VAVASAGPYASLHLAPDKPPRQHPTTQFFYPPDALIKDSQRNNRMTQVQAVRTQLKVVLMRNAEVGKYQCAVFAQTRLL